MEPLYEGALDGFRRVELHRQRLHEQLCGAPGPEHQFLPRLRTARDRRDRLVHAMILRLQALMLPITRWYWADTESDRRLTREDKT